MVVVRIQRVAVAVVGGGIEAVVAKAAETDERVREVEWALEVVARGVVERGYVTIVDINRSYAKVWCDGVQVLIKELVKAGRVTEEMVVRGNHSQTS